MLFRDAIIRRIRDSLRQNFLSVCIEGSMPDGLQSIIIVDGRRIPGFSAVNLLGNENLIYADAKAAGYRRGHYVVTTWEFKKSYPCTNHHDWYEYKGIDQLLTTLMWGSPDEQIAERQQPGEVNDDQEAKQTTIQKADYELRRDATEGGN